MPKLFIVLVFALALISSCNNQQSKAAMSTDHSADVAAIMNADSAWDRASEAKSAEAWLSNYSDDAIMMPPGEKICKDKTSRELSIKKMFAIPGMSLRFQTTKVDIAQMGDLGYAVGVYQFGIQDSDGKEFHETGKYCETWKKQPDGKWKCIVDIWNADLAK